MASTEQARHQIDFIPDEQHKTDSHDHQIPYTISPPSSSRPSTPATPSSAIDDLQVSPKTIVLNTMLDPSARKSDNALVPALPAKSSLRASRLLASLQKTSADRTPVLTPAAPHILYLSSEEDASSSADDFSDCEYLSDSESLDPAPEQQPARIISVVFSGKPSLVELPRRSVSPASAESPAGELLRASTAQSLMRKSSASSDLSMAYYRPPRSSSMVRTPDGPKHPFLQSDPFASKSDVLDEREAQQTRKATAMFKRTLSLVRKRSKPSLNPAAATSRENVSPSPARMQQLGEEKVEHHVSEPGAQTQTQAQASKAGPTYHEILTSARRSSQSVASPSSSEASSPVSPVCKKTRHGFMRRKSIRA